MKKLQQRVFTTGFLLLGAAGSAHAQPPSQDLPEPGIWALLAIGGAAYWLARRNK